MKTRWMPAVALLLVGAMLFWTRIERRVEHQPQAEETPPVTAAEVAMLTTPPGPEAPVIPAEPLAKAGPRMPVEPAPALEKDNADHRYCEIRGRFLLPSGGPAQRVPFEVHGWRANQEREVRYGEPGAWQDQTGETDADGRLSVRFDPPRAFQFTLVAELPGHAAAQWRWGEILRGALIDLGEVELVSGGTIEGRVIDAHGNTVTDGRWIVYADSLGLGERNGRDETRVITPADSATGRFRAENVMPGRVELKAYSPVANWIDGPQIFVQSGETVTADIVYAGPDNSRRITVVTFCDRFFVMSEPEPERIRLYAAGSASRSAHWIQGSSQSFSFDGLEPGSYTIEIDDPRYLPWKRSSVSPGTRIEARLEGASALRLEVIDADRRPVEEYTVRVRFRNMDFQPDEFEIAHETGGLLPGMFPGDYTITVRAGELLGAIDVDGLAPGETRAITVEVGSGSVVGGRVLYSDGMPASRVDVALLSARPIDPERTQAFEWSVADRVIFEEGVEKGSTDENGLFRFALTRPGEYLVHASTASGLGAVSEKLVLAPNRGQEGLELVLPRGGTVAGRILAPPGVSCAGLRVWIGSEAKSSRSMNSTSVAACELGADGRFEVGSIHPGLATLYLLLPLQGRRTGGGGFSASGGLNDQVALGTLEVVNGGRIERNFEVPEFPGTVTLSVLVNGAAAAGVQIGLSKRGDEHSFGVTGETNARGQFGPALAFPGSWAVSVHEPDVGWHHPHPIPVLVTTASESHMQVSVQVSEASLVFLDAKSGAPLGERLISLLGPPGDQWRSANPLPRRKTDAEGRASWTLTTGEYRFQLVSEEDEPWFDNAQEGSGTTARTAAITWTLEGPLVREVRL